MTNHATTTPTVFTFDTHSVRSIIINDEPWFVAADVCAVLDIANNRDAIARLDDDERGVATTDTPSKNQHGEFGTVKQELTIINESGLYSLTLTSRKPEAKRFKKWITSEVLPAIRKTGGYSLHSTTKKQPKAISEATRLYKSLLSVAKTVFSGNQALLSANNGTRNITGVDVLAHVGATHLLSEIQEQLFTATDLGKPLGLSPIEVNIQLEAQGLLTSHRDSKGRKVYELTDTGKQYGCYTDTGKKHSNGSPVKQIKWYGSAARFLTQKGIGR
jgi:prophage antirepressor-like protein